MKTASTELLRAAGCTARLLHAIVWRSLVFVSRKLAVLGRGPAAARFTRVELAAGQSNQVEVSLKLSQLVLTVGDGRRLVASDSYEATFTVR